MSAYDDGYAVGHYHKNNDGYDPRWDMADHSRAGTLDEFMRGFHDGYEGKERLVSQDQPDTPVSPLRNEES